MTDDLGKLQEELLLSSMAMGRFRKTNNALGYKQERAHYERIKRKMRRLGWR